MVTYSLSEPRVLIPPSCLVSFDITDQLRLKHFTDIIIRKLVSFHVKHFTPERCETGAASWVHRYKGVEKQRKRLCLTFSEVHFLSPWWMCCFYVLAPKRKSQQYLLTDWASALKCLINLSVLCGTFPFVKMLFEINFCIPSYPQRRRGFVKESFRGYFCISFCPPVGLNNSARNKDPFSLRSCCIMKDTERYDESRRQ